MITKQKKKDFSRDYLIIGTCVIHTCTESLYIYNSKREERDRGRFNDKKKVLSDQVQLFGGYGT